jgi:hypothetical protein
MTWVNRQGLLMAWACELFLEKKMVLSRDLKCVHWEVQ